jgi:hypothetical protein
MIKVSIPRGSTIEFYDEETGQNITVTANADKWPVAKVSYCRSLMTLKDLMNLLFIKERKND